MTQQKKFSRLRMYCRALDLSMWKLSELSGLNVGTVSTIYNGGKKVKGKWVDIDPRVKTANALCLTLRKVSKAKGAAIPESEFTIENLFVRETKEEA